MQKSNMKVYKLLIMSFLSVAFVSCEAAQDSAGKAFDNAGSVIRSGEKKIYMPSSGASSSKKSTSSASDGDDSDYRRY